jgi:DNA repair protein RadC
MTEPALRLLRSVSDVMATVGRERLSKPATITINAVAEYLQTQIGHTRVEEVRVLYLRGDRTPIRDELVAKGSYSQASIDPREIVRRALDIGAASILLAHNHPSGSCRPSTSDIEVTRTLARALALFEISVFDHLIVTPRRWCSMLAEGYL